MGIKEFSTMYSSTPCDSLMATTSNYYNAVDLLAK